ncbi:MAG: DUF2975 domain-containing protein [Eubacteriales bacterium]
MKMQEKKLKKFNVYKNITNVLFILTVILGALFLVTSVLATSFLSVSGYDVIDIVRKILTEVNPEALALIPNNFTIPYGLIITGIIAALFSMALTAYIFKAVSIMFGRIVQEETPFTEGVVKGLKHMGIAFFVYTAIIFIIGIIASTATNHPMNMNIDITIKWTYIMFGLLLFSLGEIFEFGMNLQNDSESIV